MSLPVTVGTSDPKGRDQPMIPPVLAANDNDARPGPARWHSGRGENKRRGMCPYFLARPRPPLAQQGLFILRQELFQP